eukprot:TRINITY_DN1522_c0_g1_i2.p1 TRINITY_DN1522_c0_g1~~TRINITY_DN1522_c0_g1_i2.p1  ORF type:complete len:396 (+),score=92.24 TRINITY_DN1522_c0_g1_i2:85-1188(+)
MPPRTLCLAVGCACLLFTLVGREVYWSRRFSGLLPRLATPCGGCAEPAPVGRQTPQSAVSAQLPAGNASGPLPPWDNERCLREMVANVPVDSNGQVFPHHAFVQRNGIWAKYAGEAREGPRFRKFNGLMTCGNCVVLLVGGNIECADCEELYDRYKCTVLVLEPVPAFFKQLSALYKGHAGIKPFNIGLGDKTRNISMDPRRVQGMGGQGTFIMDLGEASSTAAAQDVLRILSPTDALRELGLASGPIVDLLHVNCEGCEWEMFAALHRFDLLRRFRVIQVGTHNYPHDHAFKGGIEAYCRFRKDLRETHSMAWGAPYSWERWLLRPFPALPPPGPASANCPGDRATLRTLAPFARPPPRAPRRRRR